MYIHMREGHLDYDPSHLPSDVPRERCEAFCGSGDAQQDQVRPKRSRQAPGSREDVEPAGEANGSAWMNGFSGLVGSTCCIRGGLMVLDAPDPGSNKPWIQLPLDLVAPGSTDWISPFGWHGHLCRPALAL